MFKKILNKKKNESDSSSDSEEEPVVHVGKKNSISSLKEKLGGGSGKKEPKASVGLLITCFWIFWDKCTSRVLFN